MSPELSHIAIAVSEVKDIAERLSTLSLSVTEQHEVPTEKVKASMVPVKVSTEFRIELLEPMSQDSPIAKFLKKRSGLHHLSFRVEGLENWQKRLQVAGIEIVPPGIRNSARGRALFIHPRSMAGVLVELEELE